MGKLVNAYIMPHPPVLVPGIGHGRERNAVSTVEAMKRAAREIAKDKPTTIVLSTPHAPCFRDYVYIEDSERIEGDFGAFGHPDIGFSGKNNGRLAALIADKAERAGISAGGLNESQKRQYGISDRLDHGAMVPLCFVARELEEFRLVVVSTPFLPFQTLYDFGKCIREAIQGLKVGETTKPVSAGSGYLILKVTSVSAPKDPSFEKEKEKIRGMLFQKALLNQLKVWTERERAASYVHISAS